MFQGLMHGSTAPITDSHGRRVPGSAATLERIRLGPRKTLIWFEESAHFLNTEQPDAFNRFFLERLRAET